MMLVCPFNVEPPYTTLLYSKIGLYRGIHLFLIFNLYHRFWVLVRTAYVLRKNKKNISIFHRKKIIFYNREIL